MLFPGQYAYVPHMTIENAVAIAGGFTPRAYRWNVTLDRPVAGGVVRNTVPPYPRPRRRYDHRDRAVVLGGE
jgi:polysaccharide export outer membrane protein